MKYLIDHNKKEIHYLEHKRAECKIEEIKEEDREYINEFESAKELIENSSYSGCISCLPLYHTR